MPTKHSDDIVSSADDGVFRLVLHHPLDDDSQQLIHACRGEPRHHYFPCGDGLRGDARRLDRVAASGPVTVHTRHLERGHA